MLGWLFAVALCFGIAAAQTNATQTQTENTTTTAVPETTTVTETTTTTIMTTTTAAATLETTPSALTTTATVVLTNPLSESELARTSVSSTLFPQSQCNGTALELLKGCSARLDACISDDTKGKDRCPCLLAWFSACGAMTELSACVGHTNAFNGFVMQCTEAGCGSVCPPLITVGTTASAARLALSTTFVGSIALALLW